MIGQGGLNTFRIYNRTVSDTRIGVKLYQALIIVKNSKKRKVQL